MCRRANSEDGEEGERSEFVVQILDQRETHGPLVTVQKHGASIMNAALHTGRSESRKGDPTAPIPWQGKEVWDRIRSKSCYPGYCSDSDSVSSLVSDTDPESETKVVQHLGPVLRFVEVD